MPITLPPQKFVDAIHAGVTEVTRRIDIYESNGTTLWKSNVGFADGSISVDQTRQERRTGSCSLDNLDGSLKPFPTGFWYDKVIKPFRGVRHPDGTTWERQLGEFRIDTIGTSHEPSLVRVNFRDNTKLLTTSKFIVDTSFAINTPVENVIGAIATAGGVTRQRLPVTGKNTGKEFLFERGTERWAAINELANAYGLEAFFAPDGFLEVKVFSDPLLDPQEYTFQTGAVLGNLAAFEKNTSDSRIYNHILVVGEAQDVAPVWATAKNTLAGSPTSIAKLGDRLYQYTSAFVTTTEQAQDVANRFLKLHALEQFEVPLSAIVIPYLEAGIIVGFTDPDPATGDPTKYLLSSFDIPLTLGTMSANLKRIRAVS